VTDKKLSAGAAAVKECLAADGEECRAPSIHRLRKEPDAMSVRGEVMNSGDCPEYDFKL
jgi:hypothetical protein